MIDRALFDIAFSREWGRQMRFITGPRQAGKTTLAKHKLGQEGSEHLYYLWDSRHVRQRYKQNELFFTEDAPFRSKENWVCFDEIHKMPKWKNILKTVFDETSEYYRFIVTGSTKFDIRRRVGDSLAGRYFTFRLMPFVLREVSSDRRNPVCVPQTAEDLIKESLGIECPNNDVLGQLLEYGGFPEPFLRASASFHRKWRRDYAETVIREDLGSLTRIIDREYVLDLYNLLPELVGSPLSQSSAASHIEVSPATVKSYLRRLEEFYLTFSLKPYSRNIKRSLLKAGKHYLYDWTAVKDRGLRFENYVACELRTRLMMWEDLSGEEFGLFYVRDKLKQETDFLVVREGEPWLLVEAKLSDGPIERHHHRTMEALGGIPFVQVCLESGVALMQKRSMHRISASRLFA